MSDESVEPPLRVLTGIDLTERSRNAFSRAILLARAPGASLKLLHVTSDALPNQVASVHEAYAADVLRDLAARARADGAAGVEEALVRGRDYEMLIEEARKSSADVIVIGTHRPSSVMQDMLGTTADRVLRHGGFPLLLVRQKAAGPYGSILVAVDFSAASRHALELAVRWFPKARITALTAYGASRRTLLGEDREAREAGAETRRLALKGFLAEVAQATGPAFDAGRIDPAVERGWAEEVILRAVEERKPDLVVVGTHARGGVQHAVLGSVAEWVLAEAPCDVLGVPPRQ